MARVVVTGGAGFLGSHLCQALLDRGDEVVAIDNLVTGSVANIEALFARPGFTYVDHDVSNYIWVPGGVDAVMHLASPASPADFERIPIQILKVGGLGTHNGLGLAKAKGAKFFLASTSEVYGDPLVHPQPESYWGNVNPIGPRGVYDEAKRYAEAMTMAYHRHHGLDVRIVRIFNSILADEQVLYDDGVELRREAIGELAERIGRPCSDLVGYAVPAFGDGGASAVAGARALVGHPPTGPCYQVRTQYGRSIRVTGDHSLFVAGPAGEPVAQPVSTLVPGDLVAIAGRIDVPERDRPTVSMLDVWASTGGDPWALNVSWPGVGEVAWSRRHELLGYLNATVPEADARAGHRTRIVAIRRTDELTLAEARRLGIAIPRDAVVRPRAPGRSGTLPVTIELSDELLWLFGLWVAGGRRVEHGTDAFIELSGDVDPLERAAKIAQRDLGVHVDWAPAGGGRAAGAATIALHGVLLLRLLSRLGFPDDVARITGWILGLPRARLKFFIEGYREGDPAPSGPTRVDGAPGGHEFATASEGLRDDLVVAFNRFGLCPSIACCESRLAASTAGAGERRDRPWRLTLAGVTPWSPLEWDRGVGQDIDARRTGDLVWAAVEAIERVAPTELVYDFCVPGFENFYAGTGVMAHNTYGPRMRPDDGRAVSNFMVQALRGEPITIFGDGSQTRSFTYVDDEIRGFLALLDSDVTTPVNIGNRDEYTIKQLAEMTLNVTGSSSTLTYLPLPIDDPAQRRPDITMARTLLGWEPTMQLRDGLERTAEYFRSVL